MLHRPIEIARLIVQVGLLRSCLSSVQGNGDGQLVTNMELGMARWNF